MSEGGSERIDVPEGWVREDLVAGMDTIGDLGIASEYVGMGGGFKCEPCDHFIPIESVDEAECPVCGTRGLIGTIIMGRQDVTALYPEGWFDEMSDVETTDTDRQEADR